jgi:hypothetical protein
MTLGRAAVAAAVVSAWAPAWGQQSPPAYEEALAAVSEGRCERAETDRHIRFYCEEGEALWYFTPERHTAHPTYFVAPGRTISTKAPIVGGTKGRFASEEASQEWRAARVAWMRDIFAVWRADAQRLQPAPKRDGGRFYLLDPD